MSDIMKARPVRCGDKIECDKATHNQGKVQLGDGAAANGSRLQDVTHRMSPVHGKVPLPDTELT